MRGGPLLLDCSPLPRFFSVGSVITADDPPTRPERLQHPDKSWRPNYSPRANASAALWQLSSPASASSRM